MAPPAKIPKMGDKLKQLEERKKAIEEARLAKEREMAALLAEEEELRRLEQEAAAEEDNKETPAGEGKEKPNESMVEVKEELASIRMEPEETEETSEETEQVTEDKTPLIKDNKTERTEDGTIAPIRANSRKDTPAARSGSAVTHFNKVFGNMYKERETKFFVVKSFDQTNLDLAKEHNAWVTGPVNKIRFDEAFDEHSSVVLFFSIVNSGAFQGYARLVDKAKKPDPLIPWETPPGMRPDMLSASYNIDWLSQTEVPFSQVDHIRNTWNQNKKVKASRDGQELSSRAGGELGLMFPLDGVCDYDVLISRIKNRRFTIGPNQGPTVSSRSARRRKHPNKPKRPLKGLLPGGIAVPKFQKYTGPGAKKRKYEGVGAA